MLENRHTSLFFISRVLVLVSLFSRTVGFSTACCRSDCVSKKLCHLKKVPWPSFSPQVACRDAASGVGCEERAVEIKHCQHSDCVR